MAEAPAANQAAVPPANMAPVLPVEAPVPPINNNDPVPPVINVAPVPPVNNQVNNGADQVPPADNAAPVPPVNPPPAVNNNPADVPVNGAAAPKAVAKAGAKAHAKRGAWDQKRKNRGMAYKADQDSKRLKIEARIKSQDDERQVLVNAMQLMQGLQATSSALYKQEDDLQWETTRRSAGWKKNKQCRFFHSTDGVNRCTAGDRCGFKH